jgi:hypothetical protein
MALNDSCHYMPVSRRSGPRSISRLCGIHDGHIYGRDTLLPVEALLEPVSAASIVSRL